MRQATTKPASILAGLWGSTARSMLVGPRVPQSRRPAVPGVGESRSPACLDPTIGALPCGAQFASCQLNSDYDYYYIGYEAE